MRNISSKEKLEQILEKYRGHQGILIPALQEVQRTYGYLSMDSLAIIAEILGIPENEVLEVASSYSQFRFEPKGQYMIRVCQGPACYLRGADRIMAAFTAELGIQPGETTADKKFSLERAACLGPCELAPVVMIGEKTYGELTPEKVAEILAEYR